MFRSMILLSILSAMFGIPSHLQANPFFNIVKIADSTGPLFSFSAPSINNDGTVAFSAALWEGASVTRDVFIGTEEGITTVVDGTGMFQYTMFGLPVINDSQQVAFRGQLLGSGKHGIFLADGTDIFTVTDDSGPFRHFGVGVSINNHGVVGFQSRLDDGEEGLYLSNGATTTTIADTTGMFSGFGNNGPGINDNDTVAFRGFLDAGGLGIFSGDEAGLAMIAGTSGEYTDFCLRPAINDDGTVLFASERDVGCDSLFSYSDGVCTHLTEGWFKNVAINNNGVVVYQGAPPSGAGNGGIFVYSAGDSHKVIAPGDSFFGSTVNGLVFLRGGLNDSGQIAFWADFTDGTSGIYRATIPEPCALILLSIIAVALLAYAWRGRPN